MLAFGRTHLLPQHEAALSHFSAQDPLACAAEVGDCLQWWIAGGSKIVLSLVPAFLCHISEEPDGWGAMPRKGARHGSDSCLGEKEPALPSRAAGLPPWAAGPPQLLHLSQPLTSREEKFRDSPTRCGDLWPLCALQQSPARPHITAPAASLPTRRVSERPRHCWACSPLGQVTNCKASLKHK